MHLLAATPGAISDGTEPIDLGPSLRLASLMHLQHPMSVDLHLDNCATKSKLVIARVLGGAGYWKYGLTQYAARLYDSGVTFVALPGDDKPDGDLRDLSTCSPEDYDALWSYLVEGGPENSTNFLSYAQAMLDGTHKPAAAKPLLRAGVYWPCTACAHHFLPRTGTGRRAWPDQPADEITAAGGAETGPSLCRLAERSAVRRDTRSDFRGSPAVSHPELHRLCRRLSP